MRIGIGSGNSYNVGTTLVQVTVTDDERSERIVRFPDLFEIVSIQMQNTDILTPDSAQSNTCSMSIVVADTQPPVLTPCPSSITLTTGPSLVCINNALNVAVFCFCFFECVRCIITVLRNAGVYCAK